MPIALSIGSGALFFTIDLDICGQRSVDRLFAVHRMQVEPVAYTVAVV
jgi:hypothetical protein